MFSKTIFAIMMAIVVSFVSGFGWDNASFLVLIPAMAALTALALSEG